MIGRPANEIPEPASPQTMLMLGVSANIRYKDL